MKINENRGSSLVWVLIMMVVLMILGTSILSVSVAETKLTEREVNSSKAYYIAQSGADAVAEYMERNPYTVDDLLGRTTVSETLGDGTYYVEVKEIVTGKVIELTSVATVRGVERTAKLLVERQSIDVLFEAAIISYSDLDVSSMDKVKGPLASHGSVNAAAKTRDVNDPEYENMPFKFVTPPLPSPALPVYTSAPFLDGIIDGTVTIDSSYTLNGIDIGNSDTLTIDVQSGDIQLVTPYIISKGSITIIGDHRVEIYVTGNGSLFQTNATTNVNQSNFRVILMPNTTLTIKTGNNSFTGHIFGPEATVIMESNASAVGSVIVENFSGASNSNMEYKKLDDLGTTSDPIILYRRGEWK